MIQTYTSLMRRFADARPGLKLFAVEEAALPVTILRTDVLIQEKKDLPATDEFFLRFVADGVDTVDGVAAYLGLPRDLVLDAAARQEGAGHVQRKDAVRFAVTQLGRTVIGDLVASQPTLQQISFVFDRLVWRPAAYPQQSLLRRSEASQAGMLLLPAATNAAITAPEIPIADLNRILRGNRATVLRVNRLASRRHLWAPAKLLVFGDSATRDLELALYIDDEITQLHEYPLQEVGAVERLNMRIAPPPFIPTPRFGLEHAALTSEQDDVLSIEHLDHLIHAAINAERRLTIASQSARDSIVTDSFTTYLRDRARAGTHVTIILGDEAQVDQIAAERLQKLARSNVNLEVTYADLSGTSRLIYDDVLIETNFDWLSGGQTNREYLWNAGRLTRSERRAEEVSSQLRRDAGLLHSQLS